MYAIYNGVKWGFGLTIGAVGALLMLGKIDDKLKERKFKHCRRK